MRCVLCRILVLQVYNDMASEYSKIKAIVGNSYHYTDDLGILSLERRIRSLELDIVAKQEIVKEWKEKIQRLRNQSQLKLFNK